MKSWNAWSGGNSIGGADSFNGATTMKSWNA